MEFNSPDPASTVVFPTKLIMIMYWRRPRLRYEGDNGISNVKLIYVPNQTDFFSALITPGAVVLCPAEI